MSAMNTAKRLGLGLIGALLAGGLLVAACAAPEDRGPDDPARTGRPR
ncbi:hypothetical protein [Streptomyces sp. NPDC012888]